MTKNKKVFLDCGSQIGSGFELYFKHWGLQLDDTEVHMFEPNKNSFDILKEKYTHPNIKIHNVAVWDKNESRTLNVEFCKYEKKWVGGASNILHENFLIPTYIEKDHMAEWPPKVEMETKCIDFSTFVKNNFSQEDDIHVKMDIEGAECEVLDKMLLDNTFNYMKHLAIEWHFHMRKNNPWNLNYFENFIRENSIDYIVHF
jgi:FkbM family methyltransferase